MSRSPLSDGVVRLDRFGPEYAETHLAGEDAELVHWLNGGPGTLERVTAYARRCAENWTTGNDPYAFAVLLDDSVEHVGYIDLRFEAAYLAAGQVNIAYGLFPRWRGRGVATRAVHLVCNHAAERGATQAVIRNDPGNPRSAAVARRAGFRFEARVTEADGQVLDRHLRDLQPFVPPGRSQ